MVPFTRLQYVIKIQNYIIIIQLLRGEKAKIVLSSLPVGLGFTPRCWVISNNGNKIIVGYKEGMIQVYVYTALMFILDLFIT